MSKSLWKMEIIITEAILEMESEIIMFVRMVKSDKKYRKKGHQRGRCSFFEKEDYDADKTGNTGASRITGWS